MTRKELLEKRKRKKRNAKIKKIAIIAGGVLLLLFLFFIVRNLSGHRVKKAKHKDPQTYSDDTAVKQTISDTTNANVGWNVDDTGWWYMNSDSTQFVSGWKTIEGQRYYFRDNGYLATGWVNTGEGADIYFDASGVPDPNAKQKLCAITYDDGPSQNTDMILDTLEQYDAKATFFVVGTQADYYRDELRREYEMGMEIGSHTYEHPILSFISAEEIEETMSKNDNLINELIGFTPEIMRPTGGGVNDTVRATVTKPMIQWDVDTLDWETKNPEQTIATSLEEVQDGSVILMHDLYEATAIASQTLIPSLQAQGYKLVTISELATQYGYTLEPGVEYYDFYPKNSPDPEIKAKYASGS